mgnify:CR=1 FL=1
MIYGPRGRFRALTALFRGHPMLRTHRRARCFSRDSTRSRPVAAGDGVSPEHHHRLLRRMDRRPLPGQHRESLGRRLLRPAAQRRRPGARRRPGTRRSCRCPSISAGRTAGRTSTAGPTQLRISKEIDPFSREIVAYQPEVAPVHEHAGVSRRPRAPAGRGRRTPGADSPPRRGKATCCASRPRT